MRISLYLSPRQRAPEHQLPLLNACTDMALEADRRGFAGIDLTEHHLSTHNPFQNSLLYAASLAPRLTQAHIVLATIVPAIHQPLRLVESCNLLDQLLRGRLVVGLGPGFIDDELRAFGREPAERAALYQASLDAMEAVWRFAEGDPPLDFVVGGQRGWIDRPVVPAPYRKPHPILARATSTEATMVAAARKGWPLLLARWDPDELAQRLVPYHRALADAGHDPVVVETARRWTGILKWIHVADTDAEAAAHVDATVARWFAEVPRGAPHAARGQGTVAEQPTPEAASTYRPGAIRDPAVFRRGVICGSPSTVACELQRYAESGVGQVMGQFLRDVDEIPEALRSFRLFCDEVLPRFSVADGGGNTSRLV